MSRLSETIGNPRYELLPTDSARKKLGELPDQATVAVTCHKSIDTTLDFAEAVVQHGQETGKQLEVVPHLSARLIERGGQLQDIHGLMAEIGLYGTFLVGGDAKGSRKMYDGSLELAATLYDIDPLMAKRSGSTGYPEGHPKIKPEKLMEELKAKQPYIGYIATQMCFDPEKIADWAQDVRAEGVNLPIEVGVPGVVNLETLTRVARECGVGQSMRYLQKNRAVAQQLALSGGSYDPTELVEGLTPYINAPDSNLGLHVNTFNNLRGINDWREQMLAGTEAAEPATELLEQEAS